MQDTKSKLLVLHVLSEFHFPIVDTSIISANIWSNGSAQACYSKIFIISFYWPLFRW